MTRGGGDVVDECGDLGDSVAAREVRLQFAGAAQIASVAQDSTNGASDHLGAGSARPEVEARPRPRDAGGNLGFVLRATGNDERNAR